MISEFKLFGIHKKSGSHLSQWEVSLTLHCIWNRVADKWLTIMVRADLNQPCYLYATWCIVLTLKEGVPLPLFSATCEIYLIFIMCNAFLNELAIESFLIFRLKINGTSLKFSQIFNAYRKYIFWLVTVIWELWGWLWGVAVVNCPILSTKHSYKKYLGYEWWFN